MHDPSNSQCELSGGWLVDATFPAWSDAVTQYSRFESGQLELGLVIVELKTLPDGLLICTLCCVPYGSFQWSVTEEVFRPLPPASVTVMLIVADEEPQPLPTLKM